MPSSLFRSRIHLKPFCSAYLFVLFLLFTSNSFANSDEEYLSILPDPYSDKGWTKDIDRENIQIYTRDWPGSDFVAVKAVQEINASLSNITTHYADINSYKHWVENLDEAYEISAFDSDHERHVYRRMMMPWPLEDRDIVAKQQYSQDQNTKIVTIKEFEQPGVKPELEGVIRVPRTNMELLLVPISQNKTRFIFQGHNDPGGFIPSFLVNWLIEEVFYQSMLNMKHRFEEETKANRLNWINDLENKTN